MQKFFETEMITIAAVLSSGDNFAIAMVVLTAVVIIALVAITVVAVLIIVVRRSYSVKTEITGDSKKLSAFSEHSE